MSILKKIKNRFTKYGFYSFSSQKLDGPFEGYKVFAKKWNENWKDAFANSVMKLQKTDDRVSKPIIIKFFTKL